MGGISFGHGRKDHDCAKAIIARELWDRGLDEAASRVYCSITEVNQALGTECETLMRRTRAGDAGTANPRNVNKEDTVTHEELNTVIKQALTK